MGSINYEKILEKLLKEYPHAIDKIAEVINAAEKVGEYYIKISFEDIIKSEIWNSEEKVQLLRINGYNEKSQSIEYKEDIYDSQSDYAYTIKFDMFDSFKAIMQIFKDRPYESTVQKDQAYINVLNYCMANCKETNKVKYINAILDSLTEEDIKRLIKTKFTGYTIRSIHNESIMTYIISTKHLGLIKKYLKYVDDISIYMSDAVATGNISIVQLFLDNGADVNYLPDEVIINALTPLKTAIALSDYKMFEFLVNNGADVNFKGECNDFINRINNPKIDISGECERYIKNIKENSSEVQYIQLARKTSPLEFASKIVNHEFNRGSYIFEFAGETFYIKNRLTSKSDKIKDREKMIDYIYDNIEDKSTVNYTDLVEFSSISENLDNLKKYVLSAKLNNYSLDFDAIFNNMFFLETLRSKVEYTNQLLDIISLLDNKDELYLKLFEIYKEKCTGKGKYIYSKGDNQFCINILSRISENVRKKIIIVPYCKNIKALEDLINLGFDINQVDEEGNNILYYLLNTSTDLLDSEIDLFNYLLDKIDLSNKNIHGKTALYYAMNTFDTENESFNSSKKIVCPKRNVESVIATLISKMSKEDIINDEVIKTLESRLEVTLYYLMWAPECIYQRHRELFTALVDKGIPISNKILNEVFTVLNDNGIALETFIDYDATLEFVFSKLDRDTEIQKIDFIKEYNEIINYIKFENSTFNGFILKLIKFNKIILSLNKFYNQHVVNKYKPEEYLKFYRRKYNTIYENLDKYLLLIFINAMNKYGRDKLSKMLDCVPNYDINYFVVQEDINYSYWDYYETISDYEGYNEELNEEIYGNEHFEANGIEFIGENIWFTGGLIQYAYLIDDLALVKELQNRGAELKLMLEDENHTWDYVNSHTMKNYLEPLVGKMEYASLNEDEKAFYLSLINSDNSKK